METTVVNFSDKSSTSLLDINSDGAWNAVKQEDYPWFDITPVTAEWSIQTSDYSARE